MVQTVQDSVSPHDLMDPQMATAMERMAAIAEELGPVPAKQTPGEVRTRTEAERLFWNAERGG